MGAIYHDYKFKSPKYKNFWEDELQNTIQNMQIQYKNRLSINRVLSIFKKVFHVIPITLKTDKSPEMGYLRTLVLYILVQYSSESKEKIAKEFQINPNELEDFDKIESINIEMLSGTKIFFEYFKEDYLIERKSTLAFQEEMFVHFDTSKDYMDNANA